RSQGGGGGPAASHVSARGSARDQGEPEPARKARDCGRGSSAGAAATSGGGGQPRAQTSGQAPPAIDEPSDAAMSAFDVSVGISPRQSFDSWAPFVAGLEAEGVRRVWVIDSQLAMKDVYAGLVVAALNTTRIGLGTGVTNAVTRHPTVTANAIAAVAEISHGRALLGIDASPPAGPLSRSAGEPPPFS